MAYLHPGVYVEEIPSGSRPIEGVGTSTAAFVGYTTKGPIGEPNLIFKWDDYVKEYGGIRDLKKAKQGDPMGLSVSAFYQNGGTKAYIVRLADQAKKAVGYVDHPGQIGKKALKFTAVNEGTWANNVVINIENNLVSDNDGSRNYDVYVKEEITDDDGNVKFNDLESFLSVSLNSDKALYIENVINDDPEVVTVEIVEDIRGLSIYSDQYLGSSTSGDLSAVSLNFSSLSSDTKRKMKIGLDGDSYKTITLDKTDFSSLDDVAINIQEKVRALSSGGGEKAYSEFTCVAEDDKLILTSGSRKSDSYVDIDDDYNIAITLKLGIESTSDYVGFSKSGDLSGLAVNLNDTGLYPDDSSISITGTIDGAEFTHVFNRVDSFDLAEARNQLDTISGINCSIVDTNYLQLTSGTNKSSSAVVINSEVGLAPKLKLGTSPTDIYDAEEISGQVAHENSLLIATSISGDLDDTEAAAITTTDPEHRTLHITIDGSDREIILDADTYATVEMFRSQIETKIQALVSDLATFAVTTVDGIGASKTRLVLTSPSQTASSAISVRISDPLAIALHLGVRTEDAKEIRGVETTAMENKDTNFRTVLYGQESADIQIPTDRLDGGDDGNPPEQSDYDEVFTKFVKFRDINIICLPGQYWSEDGTGNSAAIIQKAIGHAERMKSRMVIVDPPPTYELETAKMVIDMGLPSQTYCVVYYPWVEAANRFYHAELNPGLPKNVLVPPCGYAAGMWAKTDARRGVWKAPAGMATGLLGVSKLEHTVEDDEQDALNPLGVNCLRSMPGAGKVIWGARTRATKADPEWRYVPVRRTAIMIEQSIYEGIQWAVFEPNDHRLWSSLRGNIDGFMNSLFRVGAFQGEKASDAYFVRCGLGNTMTQAEIDAGQVIVIVGFAPLKPAEFVIVRIQQKVNQQ